MLLRQLCAAWARCATVSSTCTRRSAAAKVAALTSGPTAGAVPKAGGDPGGGGAWGADDGAATGGGPATAAEPTRAAHEVTRNWRREFDMARTSESAYVSVRAHRTARAAMSHLACWRKRLVLLSLSTLAGGPLWLDAQAVPDTASAPGELSWSSDSTGPGRFVAVHGRRAAIFGYPDGGLESWVYPLQVFSSFRVAFRPQDGSSEI